VRPNLPQPRAPTGGPLCRSAGAHLWSLITSSLAHGPQASGSSPTPQQIARGRRGGRPNPAGISVIVPSLGLKIYGWVGFSLNPPCDSPCRAYRDPFFPKATQRSVLHRHCRTARPRENAGHFGTGSSLGAPRYRGGSCLKLGAHWCHRAGVNSPASPRIRRAAWPDLLGTGIGVSGTSSHSPSFPLLLAPTGIANAVRDHLGAVRRRCSTAGEASPAAWCARDRRRHACRQM
jgi:hypothetical protein